MRSSMRRIACLALAAVLLAAAWGCASQPEDTGKSVDLAALMDAMVWRITDSKRLLPTRI